MVGKDFRDTDNVRNQSNSCTGMYPLWVAKDKLKNQDPEHNQSDHASSTMPYLFSWCLTTRTTRSYDPQLNWTLHVITLKTSHF